ncbi:MAG TPA: MraY family glycosyltransferase [Thermoleophilaceae bacterium]|jgi:UDP-GlcNAc:undecaprenyl-phosphate GlcNAc-1-phosphate transferase
MPVVSLYGLRYKRMRMSFWDSLRGLVEHGSVAWGFVVAAAIVLLLTPVTAWLAPKIGGIDTGGDRPRVHTKPVPRIGGLAIVIGILVASLIFVDLDGPLLGILIGTAGVALVGLIDDTLGLRPGPKLLAVLALTLVPVLGWHLKMDHLSLPILGSVNLGWAAYPITILWIAFLANLVNLIDGMDGLAAGIVAIAAGSFALLAVSFDRIPPAALAAIVCGATLAFLPRNYHPAKIFMGDTGALALGYLLAAIAVQGVLKTAATIALAGPLLVMAVPILDTSFVVLKRLKYRRAPWGADQNHFYHRFMRIGFSQRRTAAYLHLWALLLAAYGIMLRFVPPRPFGVWSVHNSVIAILVGSAVLAASVWMVYTLEILKARHFRAIGLGRFVREESEEDRVPSEDQAAQDEAVERALTGGR